MRKNNGRVQKFITGQESLENFDNYVETMKKAGLDELTIVRQQQYERYLEFMSN